MDIIAFYLPQYHQQLIIMSGGERSFTEWTNVAKAKPLS